MLTFKTRDPIMSMKLTSYKANHKKITKKYYK